MEIRVFLSRTKLLLVPFSSVILTSVLFISFSFFLFFYFFFFVAIIFRIRDHNLDMHYIAANIIPLKNLRESSAKTVESPAAGRLIFSKNILFKIIDVILRLSFC